MKIAVKVLLFFLLLGIGIVIGYQSAQCAKKTKHLQQADTPELSMPPESSGSYSIMPAKHHFGKVMEGEARSGSFQISVPKGEKVRFGRLYSPCPCVFVTAPKNAFEPGEIPTFNVRIHSLSLEGDKRFPAFVELVSPVKEVLQANVSISVEREPAKVALRPNAFYYGTIKGKKIASLTIYNLTEKPVQIFSVTPEQKEILPKNFKPIRLEAGNSHSIELEASSETLPQGPLRTVVAIETDCPEHARMRIPVEGTVR